MVPATGVMIFPGLFMALLLTLTIRRKGFYIVVAATPVLLISLPSPYLFPPLSTTSPLPLSLSITLTYTFHSHPSLLSTPSSPSLPLSLSITLTLIHLPFSSTITFHPIVH